MANTVGPFKNRSFLGDWRCVLSTSTHPEGRHRVSTFQVLAVKTSVIVLHVYYCLIEDVCNVIVIVLKVTIRPALQKALAVATALFAKPAHRGRGARCTVDRR